ncbi:MAG: MFS transporter [Acidimicrobiales bacterium]
MLITAPLRRKDFRLLWTGMAVSLLGDGIFIVAVAWQAYAISDRPSALAYVGVATSAPQLAFLLVGGAVSDRSSRRTVLFWADLVRALAVGGLAALVAGGSAHLYDLCLVGAVIGTATAFASPSFDALVPQLVPGPELVQANAIEQFARPFALQLAGPALGGVAVALLRPSGSFALDAASFAFSALCVRRMVAIDGYRATTGATRAGLRQETGARLRHEIGEGLRYVRSQVWLWGTFLSATFTYLLFIGPTQVLLPYVVRNSLHQGASTYGEVLAAGGVGALIGAIVSGHRRHPRRPMLWIYGWWTLATLAVAGYGLATSAWGLAGAALVVNGAEAAGTVVWATLKQRRVVNSMLGRVSSIDWAISTALLPLSYALTAPVAEALGARQTLVGVGVLGAVVTAGFLFLPGMRSGETRRAVLASERA